MSFAIRIELEKFNVSLIKDDSIRFLIANSRILEPESSFAKRLLQLAKLSTIVQII